MAICATLSSATAALIDLTPAGGSSGSSGTVTLASLIAANPNEGIVVGDKVFTGFSYSNGGDMPSAAGVNVQGFKDLDGNWGLTFQGAFLDLPGNGFSDAHISFYVEVSPEGQEAGWQISDAHLFLDGPGLGANSFFSVDESFSQQYPANSMNAYASTMGPTLETVLSDSTIFPTPTTKLFVTKDILAVAGQGATQPARGTVIRQTFSQTQVPEPVTMALAGMGGLAVVAIGRRRK
jgi:hypothetical protein